MQDAGEQATPARGTRLRAGTGPLTASRDEAMSARATKAVQDARIPADSRDAIPLKIAATRFALDRRGTVEDPTMTEDAVLAELGPLFEEIFGEPIALSPGLTAEDVEGWDSTRMIEIIVAVEAHFRITLTTREVDGLRSVGDLAAVIVRRSAGRLTGG
ncbi:acyl carrier protein [Methylobacterium variabile]|jgi:acyl carrier protein|nr:acyl carrier protein [Methylobacterium variabile]